MQGQEANYFGVILGLSESSNLSLATNIITGTTMKKITEYCHLCKEKIAEHDEEPFGWSKEKQRHNCKEWTEITNKQKENSTYE